MRECFASQSHALYSTQYSTVRCSAYSTSTSVCIASDFLAVRNPIRGKFSATKAKAMKKIVLCAAFTLLVSIPQFFSVRVVLKEPSQSAALRNATVASFASSARSSTQWQTAATAPTTATATASAPATESNRRSSGWRPTGEYSTRSHSAALPVVISEPLETVSEFPFAVVSDGYSTNWMLPEERRERSPLSQRSGITEPIEMTISASFELAKGNGSSHVVEKQISRSPEQCARQIFEEVEPIATVLRTIGYSYIGQLLFTIIPLVLLTTLNTLLVVHTLRYSRRRKKMAHAHVCFERHDPPKSSPLSPSAHTTAYNSTVIVNTKLQKNGHNSGAETKSKKNSSAGGANGSAVNAESNGHNVLREQHSPAIQHDAPLKESPFNDCKVSSPLPLQHVAPVLHQKVSASPNTGCALVVAGGSSGGLATRTPSARRKASVATSFRRFESNVAREQHKITRMLILIVVFFLLCHLPQLLGTLWKEYVERVRVGSREWENARRIFGNVSNACLQINCVANFVFYSLLSTKFYSTFKNIFLGLCNRRRRGASSISAMVGRRNSFGGAFASLAPGLGPVLGPVAPLALGLEPTSTATAATTSTGLIHTSCSGSYSLELHAHPLGRSQCHQIMHRPVSVRFTIPAGGVLRTDSTDVECSTSIEGLL